MGAIQQFLFRVLIIPMNLIGLISRKYRAELHIIDVEKEHKTMSEVDEMFKKSIGEFLNGKKEETIEA